MLSPSRCPRDRRLGSPSWTGWTGHGHSRGTTSCRRRRLTCCVALQTDGGRARIPACAGPGAIRDRAPLPRQTLGRGRSRVHSGTQPEQKHGSHPYAPEEARTRMKHLLLIPNDIDTWNALSARPRSRRSCRRTPRCSRNSGMKRLPAATSSTCAWITRASSLCAAPNRPAVIRRPSTRAHWRHAGPRDRRVVAGIVSWSLVVTAGWSHPSPAHWRVDGTARDRKPRARRRRRTMANLPPRNSGGGA